MPQVRDLRRDERLLVNRGWLALAFSACAGLLTITIEDESSTVVEGAGFVGQILDVLALGDLGDLGVTIEQELANQGVEKGDVTSVRLTQITLSTPDGEDLAFLSGIAVWAEAPGLDAVRIASLEDFPEGDTSVDLVLDDVDLVEFVVAESMTITTEVTGSAPEDDTTVETYVALEVEATVQGACNAAKR